MSARSHRVRRALRQLLSQPGAILAPSIGDALSAMLVQEAGLPAVHCSGSVLHSAAGYADGGLLTLTEMAGSIAAIADAVDIPVIADADTGFGNAANVVRTVREYERSGAAAMHIEDQVTPTRPAMVPGFRIQTIAKQAMLDKIKAALDARVDDQFMIIARSDVKSDRQEVLDRLAACLDAGADAAWLPPGSIDEMRAARRLLGGPLIGVMPLGLTVAQFGEVADCALLPGAMQIVALHAQRQMLDNVKNNGSVQSYFDALGDVGQTRQFYSNVGMDWLRRMESQPGG